MIHPHRRDVAAASAIHTHPNSSNYTLYVNLQRESKYYTAVQMDLVPPDGLNIVYSEDKPNVQLPSDVENSLYPYDTQSMTIPGYGTMTYLSSNANDLFGLNQYN